MIPTSDGGYAIAGRVQYEVSFTLYQNAPRQTNNEGYVYTCTLDGDVFLDENEDCVNNGELPLEGWLIAATKSGQSFTPLPARILGMKCSNWIPVVMRLPSPCPPFTGLPARIAILLTCPPIQQETLDIPAQADVRLPADDGGYFHQPPAALFSSYYVVEYCNQRHHRLSMLQQKLR